MSTEEYGILKKEMERADSLYSVQKDIKELKDLISWSNYKLDQKEIFSILNNINSGIEEDME